MDYGTTATYSPDDNKLRLCASARLDDETYQRSRVVGFRWAPKQELFFAHWSPAAEDFALELAGEIGDEDSTLMDRAEDRSERFEGYQANRMRDATAAADHVESIAGQIPLGQPILVGHHSQKRAERDAKRIENGMRKAVKMWETSTYWKGRAASAIRHARYLESVPVRLRRIKKLEAERRKRVRSYTPKDDRRFLQVPWHCPTCGDAFCKVHEEASVPCEHALCGAGCAVHPVRVASLPAIEKSQARWVAHLDRRLEYERAMLGDYVAPVRKRPKAPPLLNYRADPITIRSKWRAGETDTYPQLAMTKAEYAKVYKDYKGTRVAADGSHRVRIVIQRQTWSVVFLTDSKVHAKPEAVAA